MKKTVTDILVAICVGFIWVFSVIGGTLLVVFCWLIDLFGVMDIEEAYITVFHKWAGQCKTFMDVDPKEEVEELF